MPIVKLAGAMKELEQEQVLLLEAIDPGSIPDVAAWSRNTGNPLPAQETTGKVMRFWVEKA